MFELFKIIWDLFMVRRSFRSGQLTVRKLLITLGLVALAYGMLVPSFVLYDKHPQYKPLFICAVILTAADLILLIVLGFRWQRDWFAAQAARSEDPGQ